jgi:PAS domain-containing protein
MTRSVLAVAGMLLGLAGAVFFSCSGVLIWNVKKEVNRQAGVLAGRADEAADAADHAVDFVYKILDQAGDDLQLARRQVSQQPTQPSNPFVQMAARQATQQLVGSVNQVHGAVVTASDAVVVANAALDVVGGNEQLEKLLGLNQEQMASTRNALQQATSELGRARSVLGVTINGAADSISADQLNAVDNALGQARGFTDEMAKVVKTARGKVNDTRREVDVWSYRIALATTLVCALATVGQLFMIRFCWRTLRGLPA